MIPSKLTECKREKYNGNAFHKQPMYLCKMEKKKCLKLQGFVVVFGRKAA